MSARSGEKVAPEQIRRTALEDARRAAVKAVMGTEISRGDALTEMPQCHAKKCACNADAGLQAVVDLTLKRAADEVARALMLEWDEDFSRVDHQREAWDEGYMHVMRHGTGRNTRGMNPYLEDPEPDTCLRPTPEPLDGDA